MSDHDHGGSPPTPASEVLDGTRPPVRPAPTVDQYMADDHYVEVPAAAVADLRRILNVYTQAAHQAGHITRSVEAATLAALLRDLPRTEVETEPKTTLGLTTNAAAERLNITPRRIRQLIHAGRLPAVRHGITWSLDPDDVAAHTRQR